MAHTPTRAGRPLRRRIVTLIAIAVAALAVIVAARLGTLGPGGAAAATTSPPPSVSGASNEPAMSVAAPTLEPTRQPTASPAPTPTPDPRVPAPLTGVLVPAERAERHPIAVMVDDHPDARPQAGINAASVVWHAPAEGGVPRYMLVFQENIPEAVGPIRSARQYYVEWAAELGAMYVHHGGSPQALATLARRGDGDWVYDADGYRWEGRFVFRSNNRTAPHNVMTDGDHLRQLAKRVGADDGPIDAAWSFAPEVPRAERPSGGTITVEYLYARVTYRYEARGNRYVRYIDGARSPQVDTADDEVVAPKNVVILRMRFGALRDGRPDLHRLEAHNIGEGEAWIASNGVTVKGTWKKASVTAPTLLFGPDGKAIQLAAGQTFVQVLALTDDFSVKNGTLPLAPATPEPTGD